MSHLHRVLASRIRSEPRTDCQSSCLELKAWLLPATMCDAITQDAALHSFPYNSCSSSNDDCWEVGVSQQDLWCQSGFLVIIGQIGRPPASHSPLFFRMVLEPWMLPKGSFLVIGILILNAYPLSLPEWVSMGGQVCDDCSTCIGSEL